MESSATVAGTQPPFPSARFRQSAALSGTENTPPAPTADAHDASLPPTDRQKLSVQNPEQLKISYASFNRLAFDVTVSQPGLFVLSCPYSPQWHAFIDSRTHPLIPTENNEESLPISAGHHTVEFQFRSPASLAGMVASCATLLLLGFYVAIKCATRTMQVTVGIAAILISTGCFVAWRHGLYGGDDLGTGRRDLSGFFELPVAQMQSALCFTVSDALSGQGTN
jgi:hypothetical protein